MANEIEKAIADAARRIRVAMGRVEVEMRKTREVLEQRMPVTVQPRAAEHFGLTEEERMAIAATKICDQMGDCNRCPFSVYGDCGKRKRIGILKLLRRLLAEKGVDVDDL